MPAGFFALPRAHGDAILGYDYGNGRGALNVGGLDAPRWVGIDAPSEAELFMPTRPHLVVADAPESAPPSMQRRRSDRCPDCTAIGPCARHADVGK